MQLAVYVYINSKTELTFVNIVLSSFNTNPLLLHGIIQRLNLESQVHGNL